ncbi:transcriptional regulator [Yersinia ruckeri]|uniref:helix-turn-helix transcriptional regulator n=2 Tax=Yersinia ruckeri TaxID=29486 RepID=UPI0004E41229|nr:AraC family transcriptional regulator [Yersinia ruckeri]AKA37276.1 transcriptional regulator [Yersinia ruckeri]ARZ00990.1 AraC family transcriptional regulator [Yersinia ruckeri]EKN3347637.1 helix-turn-helix transcriptional regulator [Yersinia ruckeri]EKN3360831.1 helix-turn-helix transcriptional regulator [Yersinia ruckeri]EKN4181323.1 helix-turn-helix transcriptional regulator [Yersinia ruckeri]
MQAKLSMQEISSRQAHVLHKVKLLMPALCRVRQGKKIIEWQGHTETADHSQLIVFPAGYELQIANIPAGEGYLSEIIYIPLSITNFYLKHYPLPHKKKDVQRFCIKLTNELEYCWKQLKFALDHDYSSQLLEHMLLGLLLILRETSAANIFLDSSDNTVTARCQDLLILSPSARWSARTVAEQLHMSVSTFHRHLAAEGGSFQQILDDVRLGNALNAIQTTSKPIGEIARDNGYQCPSRFTSRFQKRYQITPRALRQAIQAKDRADDGVMLSPQP